MVFNEESLLNCGIKIPKLALGVWLIENDKVSSLVKDAISIGYRHIDTAQAYKNEEGVAEGVRLSNVPREEIFVTSKVAAENKSYESAMNSINETLNKMKFDYIDMMLIHSPQPWKEVNQSDNRYLEENLEVWRALEDAKKLGKIRAIGISNFLESDIENILKNCTIKPVVNQVLAHITNTPFDLINYCKQKDIKLEAYSPIAHGEALKNKKIVEMAEKYNVSVAQLCIKYCIQLDMIVLPKSQNIERIKSNAELDFIISENDMEILKNMERIKDYGDSSFFPVFGGKM